MPHVERPTFTQSIPATAERRTIDGVRFACWTGRTGKTLRAEILPSGKCRRVVAGKWYGVYRDEHGKQRKTKTYTDRSAALETALRFERRCRAVREGREPSSVDMGGKSFLIDWVADYLAALEIQGRTPLHIKEVGIDLRRILRGAGLTTPGSVDPVKLDQYLERQRRIGRVQNRKVAEPLSLRTRNKWVATLYAFGRWLERNDRTPSNPFRKLTKANQDTDPRKTRRALSAAELDKLIQSTAKAGDRYGLSGVDRSHLYLLAAYTGLRLGSLIKLTVESFAVVAGVVASVTAKAETTKKRKLHVVPLPKDVGGIVARWLAGKTPGDRLWRCKFIRGYGSKLLQFDLAAADIPFKDATGAVFDFHALRGQYATMLVRAGVSGSVVTRLMDHSDPKLTAKYTKLAQTDLIHAVESLPNLGAKLGAEDDQSCEKVLSRTKKPAAKKSGGKSQKTGILGK